MMTYADLHAGREIQNVETGEGGTVGLVADGLADIVLSRGPVPFGTLTLPVGEVLTEWSLDGPDYDGYGPYACDSPRVGE